MSKRDIGGIILPIETSGLESELNEKIEFFENEHHRLKVELLIESRPTARYHIAKNMREALAEVENTKKLLETIREPSESIGSHTKLTLVDAIPNSTKNPSSRKKQYGIKENKSINLLHRPIGYIGITALAGVLTVLVVYLIKKHFGIPL
jgi:hypothetical protein